MYEDEDVTNKFLHVIRDKRREKYGRVLYGSDGTVENNFDAEGYFKELIMRNKIREKLKNAREKRNNMIETEDEAVKENTATLLSKMHENGESSSGLSLIQGDAKLESKDSGKGTPSGDTIQSYTDGSTRQSSLTKTMKKVKMKMRTAYTFTSACDELRNRYKKEKQKQLELLETIRQLRGISKDDFYKDVESGSENDYDVVEISENTASAKHVHQRNGIVDERNKDTVSNERKEGNGSSEQTEGKGRNERNADTGSNERNADTGSNERNEHQLNNELYVDSSIDTERILSPIANQLLTPERVTSPECIMSTANPTPEPESIKTSPSPDKNGDTPDNVIVAEVYCENHAETSEEDQNDQPNNNETDVNKDKARKSKKKYKKKRYSIVIKTTGCRIDTRWPRGHKLFTKPSLDQPYSPKEHKECFACYEQNNRIPLPISKHSDGPSNKLHEVKVKKCCKEHDAWRQTLIRIAYEKEFEYLKKRSLHLFPFQKSTLETMVSLDSHRSKHTHSKLDSLTTNNHTQRGKKTYLRFTDIQRPIKSPNKPMHDKIKELKFQSLREGSNPDQEITRTKSGHASNDQGYDSGEESLDHNSKQSYEKK